MVAKPKFDDLSDFCKEPDKYINNEINVPITSFQNDPIGLLKFIANENNITNTQVQNLLISISRLETGNWESYAYKDLNNWGGLSIEGQPMTFDSKEEGCKAFVEMMKRYYFDEGLTSVEEIGEKYCPVNPEWADLVRELMNE